eukprot:7013542-Alexandrium_andersonii.AAC.1
MDPATVATVSRGCWSGRRNFDNVGGIAMGAQARGATATAPAVGGRNTGALPLGPTLRATARPSCDQGAVVDATLRKQQL